MFTAGIIAENTREDGLYLLEAEWLGSILAGLKGCDIVLFPQSAFYPQQKNNGKEPDSLQEKEERIKQLFSTLAEEYSLYLSPGTVIEKRGDQLFRCGLLYSPDGNLVLQQEQLFLAAGENQPAWQRGTELKTVKTPLGRVGFMVGTDCWYPEVGRFLNLEGVDLVLALNRITVNPWQQLAGVWSQVQQNQFFALETAVGGINLLHAPCEITAGRTGILAPVLAEDDKLAEENISTGQLDSYLMRLGRCSEKLADVRVVRGKMEMLELQAIRKEYSLKHYLNPRLYQKSGLENLALIKESDL